MVGPAHQWAPLHQWDDGPGRVDGVDGVDQV